MIKEAREGVKLSSTFISDKKLFVWEIICLALMTASASLGLLTLVFAPCLCSRCGCCLSVFVLIAGLSAAVGVCAYTYFHLTGKSASLPKIDDIPGSVIIIPKAFGYSYWCAVAAAVGQLLASVLFSIGRGRSHEYEQTI
uniref:Uncharacterized protein n=1 Tax=Romanomermis culicivorax TaxID=13658 RepID=A0A915JHJ7_ROMCU